MAVRSATPEVDTGGPGRSWMDRDGWGCSGVLTGGQAWLEAGGIRTASFPTVTALVSLTAVTNDLAVTIRTHHHTYSPPYVSTTWVADFMVLKAAHVALISLKAAHVALISLKAAHVARVVLKVT